MESNSGAVGDDDQHQQQQQAPQPQQVQQQQQQHGHQHHQHEDPTWQRATFGSAVYNLCTAIVGGTIMGLPAALRLLGLPLGLSLLILFGVLAYISIDFLLKPTFGRHAWTYGEVMSSHHGCNMRLALDLSVVILQFTICAVYLIFVGDVLCGATSGTGVHHEGLLVEWNGGQEAWWTSRYFVVTMSTAILIGPFVALKHVDSLHYTSALSLGMGATFVAIMAALTVMRGIQGKLFWPNMAPDFSTWDTTMSVFLSLPTITTAYVCQFNIHPILVELIDRSERNMNRIVRLSMILCSVLFLVDAVAGCLLFGPDAAINILVNFDDDMDWGFAGSTTLNTVLRTFYVAHIILLFPVMFYPLRATADDLLFPNDEGEGDIFPDEEEGEGTSTSSDFNSEGIGKMTSAGTGPIPEVRGKGSPGRRSPRKGSPRGMQKKKNGWKPLLEDNTRFAWLSVALLILTIIPGLFVANIWIVGNVLGAPTIMLVGFVFPAVVALRRRRSPSDLPKLKLWETIAAYAMIVFSVIIPALAVTSSVYFLIVGPERQL